jgi:hypothetical protein
LCSASLGPLSQSPADRFAWGRCSPMHWYTGKMRCEGLDHSSCAQKIATR